MLSYHVNTQIVGRYMLIIFSEGFGALRWKKMKFEVKFCLSLVSMLSAISWCKTPFISLAVPQFVATQYLILKSRYWSVRISCQTFFVGWVGRNQFLLGLAPWLQSSRRIAWPVKNQWNLYKLVVYVFEICLQLSMTKLYVKTVSFISILFIVCW